MSKNLEGLLRPPIEIASFLTYSLISIVFALAPEYMLMTPVVAYVTVVGLMSIGIIRLRKSIKLVAYQAGLKKLPKYVMAFSKIPKKQGKLFVGRGFEWEPKHSQRIHDCEQPGKEKYLKPGRMYNLFRSIEDLSEHNFSLKPIAKLTSSQSFLNPYSPLADVGGSPTLHAVGMLEGEKNQFMGLTDRAGHVLVLGTTGVGKTRFAEILISQDIARGDVVIVFDPKGDADLMTRVYREAKRAGRLDNLYIFHLGYPEYSARYNPVGQFTRITEVASRVSGQMPSEGNSQAFREFVWRYVNVISACRNALGHRPDIEQIKYDAENIEPLVKEYLEFLFVKNESMLNIKNWRDIVKEWEPKFSNPEEKSFRKPRQMADRSNYAMALCKYYEELKKTKSFKDSCAESLITTFEYEPSKFNMLVASLMPLLEKLCTGKCSELISPDYLDGDRNRPIFTWEEVISSNGIVYVGLDALSDPEVAAAVGNSMFADLTSGSGKVYKHGVDHGLPFDIGNRRVWIHGDEFNELIGKEFIPLLNKARGAGYSVTAYTQTWSDVIARLGNEAMAGQVAGNLNSMYMLRTIELSTIKMMTDKQKQVDVSHDTDLSGFRDESDPDKNTLFTSNTEQRITSQRVEKIHPNDIIRLPKGQAFSLTDGGKLTKLRLPLPDKNDLKDLPSGFKEMAVSMKKKYRSDSNWYHFDSVIQQG